MNALRIVAEAAAQHGLSRVTQITMVIGEFAGVDEGALRAAFDLARVGTIAEGAELRIETPPLVLYCRHCENEYAAEMAGLRCPTCLGETFDVLTGRELDVKSIMGE